MEDHFIMFPVIILVAAILFIKYTIKVTWLLILVVIRIISKNKILKDNKLKGVDENVNK